MHADAVEAEAAAAVRTLDSAQWTFFRDFMNSRTSSIDENTLSLFRELHG
jgi:hypothetical protein